MLSLKLWSVIHIGGVKNVLGKINLEITQSSFGALGRRVRLGRSRTRFLARSCLVCADLKIFGGPGGASSAPFPSIWLFGGPGGTAHAPVRKPRRHFERAFLLKQGFQRPWKHFGRVFSLEQCHSVPTSPPSFN